MRDRFASWSEAAFAELVSRHIRLVLGCLAASPMSSILQDERDRIEPLVFLETDRHDGSIAQG